MYEVSQNVDLSLKVDALSKKFDQLLALNTLPTNSPNVQGVCAICSSPSHVIYDCPSASLFPEFVQEQVNVAQGFHRQNDPYSNTYNSGWRNHPNFSWRQQGGELETQIGQLANAISRRDEGKLPSHPIENPRANYHEQAKAVSTIRNGKLVDNKVGEPVKDSESNNNETKGISMTKIERKIEKELAPSSNFKTLESSPTTSYKPKDNKREDILETLKQVKSNLPLLEVIKQVPSYAKFLKDMCTFKRKSKTNADYTVHRKMRVVGGKEAVQMTDRAVMYKGHATYEPYSG
ncbi:hypothetical protein M9H77_16828 [Catharanthus roseus]|uniref:Uncharacterized protein n=1 Tax=Catharanthus roseus TaxID=4058 RepID=A0ACC0B2W3_CATRO|nr:hypothetical protein M9H77_16828 [Catharanthus roseus]